MTSTHASRTPPDRSGVRPAEHHDVEAMVSTLASAFAQDPVLCWVLGRAHDPERRLRPLFRGFAGALVATGAIAHVSRDLDGAALWKAPGDWKSGATTLIRMLPGNVRTNRHRFALALWVYGAIERIHPDEPHYYLACLGTRADRQSAGVGSTVIRAVLDRADDEGLPAYTESSNPRNVPFYVRHGFAVQREFVPVRRCPPLTILWRDPR